MPETYLDWGEIEKQLRHSGADSKQLNRIFHDKDSPWKSTSWRRGKGANKMRIKDAEAAALELLEFGGATSTPKSRIKHRLNPVNYEKAQMKAQGSSQKPQKQEIHHHAPGHSSDVRRMRAEVRRDADARRSAQGRPSTSGPSSGPRIRPPYMPGS